MGCGDCGYTFALSKKKVGPYQGYRCISPFLNGKYDLRASSCNQRRRIPGWKIQEWLDARLRQLVENEDWSWLSTNAENIADVSGQQKRLHAEIEKLEQSVRTLICKQTTAPENLEALYARELANIAEELGMKRSRLDALEQQQVHAEQVTPTQAVALQALIELTIDELWKQEESKINHLLRMIMGDKRLVVLEGR